jgi:hypothetical protein
VSDERTRCRGCGLDVTVAGHWHMHMDSVWAKTGLGPDDGVLCISCIKKRIGRALVYDDPALPPDWLRAIQDAPTRQLRLQRTVIIQAIWRASQGLGWPEAHGYVPPRHRRLRLGDGNRFAELMPAFEGLTQLDPKLATYLVEVIRSELSRRAD